MYFTIFCTKEVLRVRKKSEGATLVEEVDQTISDINLDDNSYYVASKL